LGTSCGSRLHIQSKIVELLTCYKCNTLYDIAHTLLLAGLQSPVTSMGDCEDEVVCRPVEVLPEGYHWYALQLTYKGNKLKNIMKSRDIIKRIFNNDVFIYVPYYYEDTKIQPVTEGYLFVAIKNPLKDIKVLEDSLYFKGFLKDNKGGLIIFDHAHIFKIWNTIVNTMHRTFVKGSKVRIIEGVYSSLFGIILGLDTNTFKYYVEVQLLSKKTISLFSVTSLQYVDITEEDPFALMRTFYKSVNPADRVLV